MNLSKQIGFGGDMPYVYTKFTFNHFPQFGNPAQVLKITLKFLLSETALSKGHIIRLTWSLKATATRRADFITHLDYEFFLITAS